MISTGSNHDRLTFALLLICAIVVFFAGLGARDVVTSHEARVIQVARAMYESGNPFRATKVNVPKVALVVRDGEKSLAPTTGEARMEINPWAVPVINGQIRLQKPPLPYWMTAIVFHLGGVSEFNARIVPALLGALGTLLIAHIARHVLGKRAVVPAAAIWITTHFVVDEFRKSMADPYLTFFALLAIAAWMSASFQRARFLPLVFCYVSLALGTLAKGPVIFIAVLPAIIAWHWVLRRRVPRSIPAHLIGVFLFAAILAPWVIVVLRNVPNAIELWLYELDNVEKARPWWFYFPALVQLTAPWTILWICSLALIASRWRNRSSSRRTRRRLFAFVWLLIVVIFFSIKPVKKNAYLMPACGAWVLMSTDILVMLIALARRRGFDGLPAGLAIAQWVVGVGFAAGVTVSHFRIAEFRPVPAIIAVAAIACALLPFYWIRRRHVRGWLASQFVAYAAILAFFVGVHDAEKNNVRSPRETAKMLLDYRAIDPILIDFASIPEEISVYLPLPTNSSLPTSRVLVVLDDPKKIRPFDPASIALLLGREDVFDTRLVPMFVKLGGRYRVIEVSFRSFAKR